jgi:hypothetical protein
MALFSADIGLFSFPERRGWVSPEMGLASLHCGLREWEGRGLPERTPKMFRLQRLRGG